MNESPPSPSVVLSWLRLMRAPNVFTALADVAMGWLIVTGSLEPWPPALAIALASACLYLSGMVLNDVFDFAIDSQERPQRPLPSGAISLHWARWFGFGLMIAGIASGWIAGILASGHAALPWRAGCVATALAACVLLYDGGAKHYFLGPIAMGACRFLNVLLGMSLARSVPDADEVVWQFAGFSLPHLLIALGVGIYVAGITIFAKDEAESSRRTRLFFGLGVMLLGLAMAATGPRFASEIHGISPSVHAPGPQRSTLLMGALLFFVAMRCARAIVTPHASVVQVAVKSSLLSIIVIDAALCASVQGPYVAALILLLLLPATLLSQWVYST